ncbi:MAG: hypothetical protein EA001_02160 [Oscillatoriales cyanobacterium]|nr:MAG: hypothetical protein EA001_02160 [Oscillatoriales cyanobacterium]
MGQGTQLTSPTDANGWCDQQLRARSNSDRGGCVGPVAWCAPTEMPNRAGSAGLMSTALHKQQSFKANSPINATRSGCFFRFFESGGATVDGQLPVLNRNPTAGDAIALELGFSNRFCGWDAWPVAGIALAGNCFSWKLL